MKKSTGWREIRTHLATWDKAALLALAKDLYDISAANRAFIQARCRAEDTGAEVLEAYRMRIIERFFPKKGFGDAKLGEARKAIREYHKATGNPVGTAELMLLFVENGVAYTTTYGDIDERFYDTNISVLAELAGLLKGEARAHYPKIADRLTNLVSNSDGIGWGFHDDITLIVKELEDGMEA
ncbi:hypothetical protein DB346_12825 [Verrucomicrobia bacterium LW23]|nr:hypothetical protein DB346_12825 [Verrucomicrobia bacterium LW23]